CTSLKMSVATLARIRAIPSGGDLTTVRVSRGKVSREPAYGIDIDVDDMNILPGAHGMDEAIRGIDAAGLCSKPVTELIEMRDRRWLAPRAEASRWRKFCVGTLRRWPCKIHPDDRDGIFHVAPHNRMRIGSGESEPDGRVEYDIRLLSLAGFDAIVEEGEV